MLILLKIFLNNALVTVDPPLVPPVRSKLLDATGDCSNTFVLAKGVTLFGIVLTQNVPPSLSLARPADFVQG
jgi:hypothetical protein